MTTYWQGNMCWAIANDWRCPVCGMKPERNGDGKTASGFTWGFLHSECRCDQCHAEFHMRNDIGEKATEPLPTFSRALTAALRAMWQERQLRLDEMTDDEWAETLQIAERKERTECAR